jgi:hypothetical protein
MNYRKCGLMIFSLISTVALAAEERNEIEFNAFPETVRYTVSRFIDQKAITSIARAAGDDCIKFEIESTKTVNNTDFIETDMTAAADGEIQAIPVEQSNKAQNRPRQFIYQSIDDPIKLPAVRSLNSDQAK